MLSLVICWGCVGPRYTCAKPICPCRANGSEMARAFTRRISMGTISSYVMQTDSHQATHDVYGEGSCPKFCFAVQTLALMTEPPFSPLPQTNGQHRRTANTDKLSTHTNGRHRRTVDTDDLSTQMNGRQRRTVRTLPYPTLPDPTQEQQEP